MSKKKSVKKEIEENTEEVVVEEKVEEEQDEGLNVFVSADDDIEEDDDIEDDDDIEEEEIVVSPKENVADLFKDEKVLVLKDNTAPEKIKKETSKSTAIFNGAPVSLDFIREQQRIRKDIKIVETSPNVFITI